MRVNICRGVSPIGGGVVVVVVVVVVGTVVVVVVVVVVGTTTNINTIDIMSGKLQDYGRSIDENFTQGDCWSSILSPVLCHILVSGGVFICGKS